MARSRGNRGGAEQQNLNSSGGKEAGIARRRSKLREEGRGGKGSWEGRGVEFIEENGGKAEQMDGKKI